MTTHATMAVTVLYIMFASLGLATGELVKHISFVDFSSSLPVPN